MNFTEKLAQMVKTNNSLLCVGLDPDIDKMPESVKNSAEPLFEFSKAIIDTTAGLVCAFKPNSAFYEAAGDKGITQLKNTCDYIREEYPNIPILLDFKRGDIGNTNKYYAQFAFDYIGADAITIHPYVGHKANKAYLDHRDKGIFILCRFSSPGAGEFLDLQVDGKKLYQVVAEHVMHDWNEYENCHLMMGSTYPEELSWARQTLGDKVLFLVPGAGTQGGNIEATVKAGKNSAGTGLMINSSREVMYASSGEDFAQAARQKATELRDQINQYR